MKIKSNAIKKRFTPRLPLIMPLADWLILRFKVWKRVKADIKCNGAGSGRVGAWINQNGDLLH